MQTMEHLYQFEDVVYVIGRLLFAAEDRDISLPGLEFFYTPIKKWDRSRNFHNISDLTSLAVSSKTMLAAIEHCFPLWRHFARLIGVILPDKRMCSARTSSRSISKIYYPTLFDFLYSLATHDPESGIRLTRWRPAIYSDLLLQWWSR